jgi:Flp pilus assembly protein TadD
VLNNLALSYALDGKAAEAEKLLRKAQRSAGKTPQVQQNLALVVGLAGKYDEARALAEAALPAARAAENVAYLQRLASARSTSRAEERPRNASLPQPSYQLGGPASADRAGQ